MLKHQRKILLFHNVYVSVNKHEEEYIYKMFCHFSLCQSVNKSPRPLRSVCKVCLNYDGPPATAVLASITNSGCHHGCQRCQSCHIRDEKTANFPYLSTLQQSFTRPVVMSKPLSCCVIIVYRVSAAHLPPSPYLLLLLPLLLAFKYLHICLTFLIQFV